MEQQVYSNTFGIRLISHNPDEQQQQQQQQQQNFIMASHQDNNQILISDEGTGQHLVPQVQHQYLQQDDGSQNQQQYLIQQSPGSQQVYYTNIQQSPPNVNVNRLIQSQSQSNLMQQTTQKHVVLHSQSQPKVILQRSQEMLQSNPPPLVDHQNQQIQYSFQPQHMDQQQIIIQQPQQQMKQTIYQQQTNQVNSQPQYIQLQQVASPGTKILVPSQGTPIRYSIVTRPQQQIQSPPHSQMMQVQTPEQSQIRQFRPRMITTTQMRIARPNSPQMPQLQMQQQQQRPRTPRMSAVPRLVRPPSMQAQAQPQPQQHVSRVIHTANRMNLNNGQQFYVIQQQDGQQILIAAPQQQQQPQQHQLQPTPQQVLRTTLAQQQIIQQQNTNQAQVQSQPAPPQAPPEDHSQPTTSTLPKKEGDCDDLEDSITATAISKGANSSPNENFRRNPNAQPQPRIGVVRPMNRLPQQRSSSLQIIRQRTPIRPQGLQHALGVSERESAKMLVILDNGEQRLITFTLPKETCTVQELLDQVGIDIGADSNIECIENPSPEIDYIVKVGNFATKDTAAMTKAAENHIRQQAAQQQQQQQRMVQRHAQTSEVEIVKATPEAAKLNLPPPKLVEGFLAVCNACGFSGVDHAKCERCGRIFNTEVKTVRVPGKMVNRVSINKTPVAGNVDRKDQLEAIQKKHQLTATQKLVMGRGRLPTNQVTMFPSPGGARGRGARGPRAKPVIPEVVTLSSDDEDNSNESKSSSSKANGGATTEKKHQIVQPVKKPFEPEIIDDLVADDFVRLDVSEFAEGEDKLSTSLTCRSIRIGSYKFEAAEKVEITNKGIRIAAPSVKNVKDTVILDLQHSEIVKLIVHFSKQLQIIFLYTKPSCSRYIIEQLSMTLVNERSPYYAPLSHNETHKKIVLLIDNVTDENKQTIKSIYKAHQLEEITNRDANELLVRSNGIPVNATNNNNTAINNQSLNDAILQNGEYKKILTFPQGRGGITITTYDYMCLGSDNYLNDVIIDFYLKYIHTELMEEKQRVKCHMFSQFFYKRLTTMNKDKDNRTQTAAQKRHARVSSWTKNVNLFEKDFIIIPINEQSHWFLAIICFPNLTEPRTMDTDQPIKLVTSAKKQKKKSVQIGSTTITPLSKKEDLVVELNDETSERDEAEGDDSELGSNADSDEEDVVDKGQAVKVPCILIFDSLGGAARARVVATLRDYLTVEYRVKFPDATARNYTKANMVGNIVKVPQQLNFTDCGLFLLQYVEQFFKEPIQDFRLPIKSLLNWFPQDIVTRKREDISNLIKQLMTLQGVNEVELPKLDFPTLDGKILEMSNSEGVQNAVEDAFGDEAAGDEDYSPTEEELKEADGSPPKKIYVASKKRSLDASDNNGSGEVAAKIPKRTKS